MSYLKRCLSVFAFYRYTLALFFSLLVSNSFADEELEMLAPDLSSDVRVVIDISGSMKKSDPKNLRIPASELLIGLLPEGSNAGVWTFGMYVNMLIPHGVVSESWKSTASKEIQKINSVAMYTNIGKAIEVATAGWKKPDPTARRSLILLTDGVVDISRNMADNYRERERIVEKLLPQLRQKAVTVHTIALSEHADEKLMQRLALETEGVFQTVLNAADLPKAFLQTFDNAVPQDQVPLDENYFSIDGSVDEFTALVFKGKNSPPTLLQTPDGKKLSRRSGLKTLSWLATDAYDLITVSKPQPGEWRLIADIDISNRVTVVSDLKLSVDELPRNILLGERVGIHMRLLEEGKLLEKEEFLDLVDLKVSQQHVGGRQWSASLGGKSRKGMTEPGNFFAKFGKTLVAGEHVFTIIADGKTFTRQSVQKVKVFEELVNVEVELDENSPIAVYKIAVREEGGLLAVDKTKITLVLSDENDQSEEISLERNEIDQWLGQAAPFSGAGKYSYIVKVKGEAKSGRLVDYQTSAVEVLYYPEGYVPEQDELPPAEADTAGAAADNSKEQPEPSSSIQAGPPKESAVAKEKEEKPAEKIVETPPETTPEIQEPQTPIDSAEQAPGFFESLGTGMLIAVLFGVNGLLVAAGYGIYRFIKKRKSSQKGELGEGKQKTKAGKKTKPSAQAENGTDSKKEIEEVDTKILSGDDSDLDDLGAEELEMDDESDLSDEILLDSDLESELDDLEGSEDEGGETDLESIDLDDSLLEGADIGEDSMEDDLSSSADQSAAAEEDNFDEENLDEPEAGGEDEITDLDEDFDLDIDIDELLDDNKD